MAHSPQTDWDVIVKHTDSVVAASPDGTYWFVPEPTLVSDPEGEYGDEILAAGPPHNDDAFSFHHTDQEGAKLWHRLWNQFGRLQYQPSIVRTDDVENIQSKDWDEEPLVPLRVALAGKSTLAKYLRAHGIKPIWIAAALDESESLVYDLLK